LQGYYCGSCWAFTTTAALESHYALKYDLDVSLSEQNLVDCSRNEDLHGCAGGNSASAMDYIYRNDGIDTDQSYPYEGQDSYCRFSQDSIGATDYGYVRLRSGDEHALKEAVATIGPIAVAFDSRDGDFQHYNGEGVYNSPYCYSDVWHLDHTLLVIGYGNDPEYGDDGDYWLVKN
ncbi:hypothetical protein PMAYCL1PPCAC_33155, partial [Pristionchus mayeri]